MPTIMWSNGREDYAPTWEQLLDLIRAAQWAPYDEDDFRQVLAKRAWRWSRTRIDPTVPARDLFFALEEAQLIEIIIDKEED